MSKSFQVRGREFTTHVDGRSVPAVLWLPADKSGPSGLVLVGHGGSGHKRSRLVLDVMAPLVECHGMAVAAIDGPVHGDRRAVFGDGPSVRSEFRELWARGASIAPMVADWRATIDALVKMPEIDAGAIGWYGISMGTAYGLPLVAADARIRCAVLGMWGTCRVASEPLAEAAPRVRVPVLFQRKADDEFFTPEGQLDIYDRLGSRDKRLVVYEGKHTDPTGRQLDDIVAFLADQLAPLAQMRKALDAAVVRNT